jgi:hypothetical protein
MPYRQCPNCGLSNWSTHRQCLRCCTPLEELEGFHALQPSVGSNPLRKRKVLIGIALVALLVIGGSVLTYSLTRGSLKKVANPNTAFEAALRDSSEFKVPVVVEAGRYKFYNQDERRLDQEATPEAYVLDSLGLLYIHNGMYSDVPMTRSKDGGYLVDPTTGLVPYQYKHIELELTQAGQAQSGLWEPYEVKVDGKDGWKVPIGDREFGRVVQVMQLPEGRPTGDSVWVTFTWKWRPNEIGQSFDKRNPSFHAPDKPKNFPRSSFVVVVNDSQAVYWGTAMLDRVNGVWEAHRVMWNGPEGVVLSPNMTDEIDRMVRESQSR